MPAGDLEAVTAAEILPQLRSGATAAEFDSEEKAAAQEEVAGVTAAGLTGPSGKKWLAAGEDEPLVNNLFPWTAEDVLSFNAHV